MAWFQVKYHKESIKQNTSEELPENEPEDEISEDAISVITDSCEFAQSYKFRNGTEIIKRKKPMILRWVHFDIETDSEKHYRELLMLFTPWRKEEKNLMNTFQSFEARYKSCEIQIQEKLSEYQQGGKVLNDIENMLHNVDVEDLCTNFVAPGNDHEEEIERKDQHSQTDRVGLILVNMHQIMT